MPGHLHHLQHKILFSGSRMDTWEIDVSPSFGTGTVTEAENSGNGSWQKLQLVLCPEP